jgi:septum formation protein
MVLILASNSPRRRFLLGLTGLDFEVIPADVDESTILGESPQDYVLRLAGDKARAVAALQSDTKTIISADTTVVDDGEILGKPLNAADAERMLRQLRGHTHQVYTGLALLQSDGRLLPELGFTDVPMRSYADEEMAAYVASGDPLDKAGAYAIQHDGFHPVENMKGCYANVVGLPLCHLVRSLNKIGLEPKENVPEQCQEALKYSCPVYDLILREEI